jgi:hypothetical protein
MNQPAALTLSWQSVNGITKYILQVTKNAFFNTILITDTVVGTSQKVPLTAGGKYYWRVKAINATGSGVYSSAWFVETAPIPLAPVLVSPATLTQDQPRTLSLVWDASTGAVWYVVQVSTNKFFNSIAAVDTVSATQAQIGVLSANQEYYWQVCGISVNGTGPFSPAKSFTTGTALSGSKVNIDSKSNLLSAVIPTENNLFQNYPNPFNPSTNINFSIKSSANVTLEIFNVLGQKVATVVNQFMQAGTYTYQFNASRLTSGIYIYRIQAGDFMSTKKFVLLK